MGWLPNNLNQGRLDLYYVILIILSVLNIFFYLIVAKYYKYKKVCTGSLHDKVCDIRPAAASRSHASAFPRGHCCCAILGSPLLPPGIFAAIITYVQCAREMLHGSTCWHVCVCTASSSQHLDEQRLMLRRWRSHALIQRERLPRSWTRHMAVWMCTPMTKPKQATPQSPTTTRLPRRLPTHGSPGAILITESS